MNDTAPRTLDTPKMCLWHVGKALLSAGLLLLLNQVAVLAVADLLRYLVEVMNPWWAILQPATVLLCYLATVRFYDQVDDFSFNRFCEAEPLPILLQTTPYRLELAVTVLGVTPALAGSFHTLLSFTGMNRGEITALTLAGAGLFVALESFLRIRRLGEIWSIQKDLRGSSGKKARRVLPVLKRVFQILLFNGALILLVWVGISFLPTVLSLGYGVVLLLLRPILVVGSVLLVVFLVTFVGRFSKRRKFLRRLEKLRDRRELSFTVHGHPYLALLSRRVFFGLTVTDAPHPDGKRREDLTYQVAVAGCGHRRGMVILCEGNIYQFVYSVRLRQVYGGAQRYVPSGLGMRTVSLPELAIRTTHHFTFPEGEGERVLLVDPAPHMLCVQGHKEGDVHELDNGSKVFGYTVYGKNSFVNMMERT